MRVRSFATPITTVFAAVFLLAACDRKDETVQRDEPKVAPSVGTGTSGPVTTGPKGEAQSLPQVAGGNTAPGDSGRDSAATQPKSDLTKPEEKKQMPMALQGGSHSSEALTQDRSGSSSTTASTDSGTGSSGGTGAGSTPSATATPPVAAAGAASTTSAAPGSGDTKVAAAGDADALIKKHNCVSCHAIDKKLVGPAYKEVAAKYKGDASAEAKLIDKVKKGGSGVWGPIPMPPNPAVPDGDVKAIVEWILSGAS